MAIADCRQITQDFQPVIHEVGDTQPLARLFASFTTEVDIQFENARPLIGLMVIQPLERLFLNALSAFGNHQLNL